MRLNKQQIQVLVSLHLIIALLIMGIFLLPKLEPSIPVDAQPDTSVPYVHDKFRSARPAFSENLLWETNFGGSGNEQVENTYEINGRLLVLGNTSSSDYDFDTSPDGECTFMVELDLDGTLKKYTFFEGTLAKSALFNDNILLITQSQTTKTAMYVSPDGDVVLAKSLALSIDEKIIDIFFGFSDDTINLMIELNQTSPQQKKLKILTLTKALDSLDGIVLVHPYDLEYIAAYPHGSGHIIAANIRATTTASMVIFEWKNGIQLLNMHDLSIAKRPYNAFNFFPFDGGYAALIVDGDNIADILTVSDTTLKTSSVVLLNQAEVKNAAFYSDGTYYYAYLLLNSGSSNLVRLSSDMRVLSDFSAFSFHTSMTSFRCNTTDTFFGGTHLDSVVISIINRQNTLFQYSFASEKEQIINILPFKDYLIVVCHSGAAGLDVGKNFGGRDVWIVKVQY